MSEEIKTFYLERGICLVIPSDRQLSSDSSLSIVELLKIRLYLSKYNVLPEHLELIYGSPLLIQFILSVQIKRDQIMDHITSSILNLPSDTSLNNYLKKLSDGNPLKVRILELLSDRCPICLEELDDDSIPCLLSNCGHVLCFTCCKILIQDHHGAKCSICRELFDMNSVKINDNKPSTGDLLVSKKQLVVILESEFNQFCLDRIHKLLSKTCSVLTSIETDELYWLIYYFPENVIEQFQNEEIRSEEIRCFIASVLYKIHSNDSLCKFINTPNRILRFLAVLFTQNDAKYGKPNHREKILLKGSRSYRRIILKMIDSCDTDLDKTEEEFIRSEQKWKAIFKFVHFGESQNIKNYPRAFQYANRICNGHRYAIIQKQMHQINNKFNWNGQHIIDHHKSVNKHEKKKLHKDFIFHDVENTICMSTISGKVNKYFELHDESIFDYLSDKPGLAFRLMRRISLTFEDSAILIPFLEIIIPKMNFDQQVDLYHVFSSSNEEDHPDIVVTSKSTIHWKND